MTPHIITERKFHTGLQSTLDSVPLHFSFILKDPRFQGHWDTSQQSCTRLGLHVLNQINRLNSDLLKFKYSKRLYYYLTYNDQNLNRKVFDTY